MFAVSIIVAVCTFFIPSTLGVVLFTITTGFLLSLDFSQLGTLCVGSRAARGKDGWPRESSPTPPCSFGWRLGVKELLLYLGLLLAAMTEAGLLHHFLHPAQFKNQTQILTWAPQAAVSYLLIVLFVLCWALREIQGAYVCGGLFLNPLYPRARASVQVFRQRSRGLHVAGTIRRVLLNLGEFFFLVSYFTGKCVLGPVLHVFLSFPALTVTL